jgi:RNA recognition motif-containing protein
MLTSDQTKPAEQIKTSDETNSFSVFIGNLSFSTKAKQIEQMFQTVAEV